MTSEFTLAECLKTISDLFKLEEGWHDGEGKEIHGASISFAECLLSASDWLRPYVYPTIEGWVMLEWDEDRTTHSIEIRPAEDCQFITYICVNVLTSETVTDVQWCDIDFVTITKHRNELISAVLAFINNYKNL
jgi:hypothetical protein